MEDAAFLSDTSSQRAEWTNEVHKLDTATMSWSFINARGTPPSLLGITSATMIGTKMFVLGDIGDRGSFQHDTEGVVYSMELRVFDTETSCWLETPAARLSLTSYCHSAFAFEGQLYALGGQLNHLWRFNAESCRWVKLQPQGKSSRTSEPFVALVGGRLVLCGGRWKGFGVDDLSVLDLRPTLKTLCKVAVVQSGLERSELPHDVRWELRTMTTKQKCRPLLKVDLSSWRNKFTPAQPPPVSKCLDARLCPKASAPLRFFQKALNFYRKLGK